MTDAEQTTTTLVMIRHGESIVTVNRVIGGFRTCTGLSELGRQQADRLRERLVATGEVAADVLISSNFRRAIETAELIAPAFGALEIAFDPGFGEHDPGPEIDGMTFDTYVERFGSPDWTDAHADVFPGGETVAAFHSRVGEALARALDAYRGSCIVIACHGGVIDAAFRHLLRSPMTGSFELHTLNTAITEFVSVRNGAWQLRRYNDVAHLHGLPAETTRNPATS